MGSFKNFSSVFRSVVASIPQRTIVRIPPAAKCDQPDYVPWNQERNHYGEGGRGEWVGGIRGLNGTQTLSRPLFSGIHAAGL